MEVSYAEETNFRLSILIVTRTSERFGKHVKSFSAIIKARSIRFNVANTNFDKSNSVCQSE